MPPEIGLPVPGLCSPPFGVNRRVSDRMPWPQVEFVPEVKVRPFLYE